jgi:thiol-disulfide isomerase/thioredoxin
MGSVFTALMIVFTFAANANAADALQLNDYHGKVVVIDFWASWCVPCRRSFPWMNQMQAKYADDGLVIIAVNLDNDLDDASAFLQRYPADFKVVHDSDRSLARGYDVQVMPTSFLIGRDGQVVASHLGFKTAKTDEYEAAMISALQSPRSYKEND